MQVIYMKRFDYSFLSKGNVPAKFLNLAGVIYSIKTKSGYRLKDYPDVYDSLVKIAKFQSVKASNQIEGIVTSDARIKSILSGASEPLTHDEKEIAGYKDVLELIHSGYDNYDFRQKDILFFHKTMLSFAGDIYGGEYKKVDNLIVEVDSAGNRKVRFKPISSKDTAQAMEQLELAYMEARSDPHINDLLLIPCVILDFLCIHPFLDGNGRISRLLSLLLLYKAGFDIGKYISFEAEINERKDFYYEALRLSSLKWNENENDYFPFVEDFISTLYHCYKKLDDRFSILGEGRFSKKERIEAVLLNRLTPISKAELCELLPEVSPTTVEACLGAMLKDGKITKIGAGRATRYIKK